jgi:predicted AAA+ superfamily ATPase
MIERVLQTHAVAVATRYPVVTVTGPRQSGKTTLCRMTFTGKPYVSLETPTQQEFARSDPHGFLARYPRGAVIDEVQRAPDIVSYLQEIVDAHPEPGRFILTGSQNLGLSQTVSQSLAGRTAVLQLLPLAIEEVRRFGRPAQTLFETLWAGGYPRIHERQLPAGEWLAAYVATYVERDVRQVLNIGDLLAFQTFLRLCAGRAGQLLNLSSLGADCGITHPTAKRWLSVLEATYVIFRLAPFHRNLGKRLVKAPKLYFFDTGLLCSLLGVESPLQLETHPLRGAVFENWVVAEILKYGFNRGRVPRLSFYRDRGGSEVDLLIERGAELIAVEIKSAQTPSASFFDALAKFAALNATGKRAADRLRRIVVYGGSESQKRRDGMLLSWSAIDEYAWFGS